MYPNNGSDLAGALGLVTFSASQKIIVSPPSSWRRATVHRTVALDCSSPVPRNAEKSDSKCCRTFLAGALGLEFLSIQYFTSKNPRFTTEFPISLHYLMKKIPQNIIKYHSLKGKNKGNKNAQQMQRNSPNISANFFDSILILYL